MKPRWNACGGIRYMYGTYIGPSFWFCGFWFQSQLRQAAHAANFGTCSWFHPRFIFMHLNIAWFQPFVPILEIQTELARVTELRVQNDDLGNFTYDHHMIAADRAVNHAPLFRPTSPPISFAHANVASSASAPNFFDDMADCHEAHFFCRSGRLPMARARRRGDNRRIDPIEKTTGSQLNETCCDWNLKELSVDSFLEATTSVNTWTWKNSLDGGQGPDYIPPRRSAKNFSLCSWMVSWPLHQDDAAQIEK